MYLFAWAGDPAATSRIVRRYVEEAVPHRYTNAGIRPQPWVGRSFALSPQGFADGMDDDAGTMSAWYIWSTLGLFPLTPGEPRYVVTAPLVSSATIRTGTPVLAARSPIVIHRTATDEFEINGRTIIDRHIAHRFVLGD